jgi:putative ATP-dependent endonuclease of OLD family
MRLTKLRLSGFQSFGPKTTTIDLADLTFLLGPNGSGKTAILLALARMFSPIPALRNVKTTDFYVAPTAPATLDYSPATLWLEVQVQFDEADQSIAPFFAHMRLTAPDSPPQVRIRLTATLDKDGFIEETIEYVLRSDDHDEPLERADMSRQDRACIEVHYLPARRNPGDQLSLSTTSFLGRILRAADWSDQRALLNERMQQITTSLAGNAAIKEFQKHLHQDWSRLYHGTYFTQPAIGFGQTDIRDVLRQLTLQFSPAPNNPPINFNKLSDGQQSILYISLVLACQSLASQATNPDSPLDPNTLRPPVHTIIALEEPENSLSPHHIGRVINLLRCASKDNNVQSLVATHSPSVLRRSDPSDIRFLRLDPPSRTTTIHRVQLPSAAPHARSVSDHNYVRQAVMAFPELYFSRLVVLGEGASEQIVLQRIFAAAGILDDDVSVSAIPLGGRHVNYFWRLLDELQIPHLTLLDLDHTRYGGGWGRIKYACSQLIEHGCTAFTKEEVSAFPKWDSDSQIPNAILTRLQQQGVFFSSPLDLDISMLRAFPEAYGVEERDPEKPCVDAVLGHNHSNTELLDPTITRLFDTYRNSFKDKSKPASHIAALSRLTDQQLINGLPTSLTQLVNTLKRKLTELPDD